jgi:hypothetical protein
MSWIEPPSGGALRPAPSPGIEVRAPLRSLCRCPVCGFAELRLDEVAGLRGRLELCECPRCEHRATRPLPSRMQPAAARAELDGPAAAAGAELDGRPAAAA